MHRHIIKPFTEQFRNCPKCGTLLQVRARDDDNHKFHISMGHDSLIINISSSYYIGSFQRGNGNFQFSISMVDGHIIYSDTTNQFISLYDLNIILFKDCEHCAKHAPPEAFHQSINLFYDRTESHFIAQPWEEFFSFTYDDNYYYFSNSFRNKRSFLSIQTLTSTARSPIVHTPFIPFEKFEFKDKEKLLSKMNSIRLLV